MERNDLIQKRGRRRECILYILALLSMNIIREEASRLREEASCRKQRRRNKQRRGTEGLKQSKNCCKIYRGVEPSTVLQTYILVDK